MLFSSNKPEKQSDDALIAIFRKENNLDVLAILFTRYTHLVYGVALKYLKNREDSQDAVTQIFEVLIKEVPKHNIKNFKSWLHSVTRNHCLMQLRKQSSDKRNFEKFSADSFMESEQTLHPIDKEETNSVNEVLKKCLERLKEEQRSCVTLFYYEEKCYREISEELKLDEKKVKSSIQNGKRNLKICIERKTEHES